MKVDANPVELKGRMQVFVDGTLVYSKQAGLIVENPQRTPSEPAELAQQLFEGERIFLSDYATYCLRFGARNGGPEGQKPGKCLPFPAPELEAVGGIIR